MHRHYSLGTADLVALLAAHRAATTEHTVLDEHAETMEEAWAHVEHAETRRPGRRGAEG